MVNDEKTLIRKLASPSQGTIMRRLQERFWALAAGLWALFACFALSFFLPPFFFSPLLPLSFFFSEPFWSAAAERFPPFAAPLRTGPVWAAVEVAAPAPCETTTQFPKPAVVVKDARHRFLAAPPAHLVPAGSWTVSCCVVSFVGAYAASEYKGNGYKRKHAQHHH